MAHSDRFPHDTEDRSPSGPKPATATRWWRWRLTRVLAGTLVFLLLATIGAGEYLLHHLEPILRKRLIETLSRSFNSPVELHALSISLFRGIEVNGYGLRIPFEAAPTGAPPAPAGNLLTLAHFRFRTTFRALLHDSTHVDEFRAEGVEIHIPPHGLRGGLFGSRGDGTLPADPAHPRVRPRIAFTIDQLVNDDVKLFLETDKPGKAPLEFDIRHLELRDIGPDRQSLYSADLVNAKPRGDIEASGHFGPWASEDPRETPIDGDYTFRNADLTTIRGIGGTLHSSGHYSGQLDRLVVDGTADVPNFSLDTAHHPVPLHAAFHAFVDGVTGDTTLAPVQARLGHSSFTTQGKIVKVPGRGHDIALDVSIPGGQVADFLMLGVRTAPPLLTGALAMHAKLHVPPGPERVPLKMELTGDFRIAGVHFSNARFQDRVDGLSARATGHPEEAKSVSNDRVAQAASAMSATFSLQHGVMTATDVSYTLPGATVLLNGVYSMDGNVFEFKGHARTAATASQMVGGWKGLLLLPFDKLLKKDGAGVDLPIEVSGTQGDVHFGLAMHDAEESTAGMARDLKNRRSGNIAVGPKPSR